MLADSSKQKLTAQRLLKNSAFPHEVSERELLETHISWVVLTGPFAYKIKKPVRFDFVDYSSLERRRGFCEKEVELNRRFAPELYVGVVPIFSRDGELKFGGESEPMSTLEAAATDDALMEYAVKMRQFPQQAIVAGQLEQSALTAAVVEQLGIDVAKFHESAERVLPTLASAQPEQLLADANDNFALLAPDFEHDQRALAICKLEDWTNEQFQKLRSVFADRLNDGKLRRCHGDMHLKNIVQLDGRLVPFDGIEFNEDFQWIDVLSEIAFPVMDFVARGRSDLGWRMLNAYLESTGDYEGLAVLKFYLVYRAMVRAKVTWLNPQNRTSEVRRKYSTDPADVDPLAGPWDKYLAAANHFAFGLKPSLSIMHGFSGSGKSTVAMQAIADSGGVRIRSDVERHRLADWFQPQHEYAAAMTDWVYAYLLRMARAVIESGLPVVIDATFLKREQRAEFENLAREINVPYAILDCDATFEELCRRIENRVSGPSEATIEVLRMQMKTHDPLTADELRFVRESLD